jgi:hypothetical protein
MFDIRPLVGLLRAALHKRWAVLLSIVTLMYVAARVSALDKRGVDENLPLAMEEIVPLSRAHAHNDYQHRRPLLDALARGFSSIEADVWLSDARLLVAHHYWQTAPSRTLAALYLEPLRKRVARHHGVVYGGSKQTVQLLIDVKTDADESYRVIRAELQRYSSMLTHFSRGAVHLGAVTAIISGNCPSEIMAREYDRLAACDGRIDDLQGASTASLMPLISEDWGSVFDWQGDGPMPSVQRARLQHMTRTAHARGQKLRFWSTPDTSRSSEQSSVWSELVAAGVDYINTDALDTLRGFLLRHDPQFAKRVAPTPWTNVPVQSPHG